MRTTPGCELCSSLRMCCRREGGMTVSRLLIRHPCWTESSFLRRKNGLSSGMVQMWAGQPFWFINKALVRIGWRAVSRAVAESNTGCLLSCDADTRKISSSTLGSLLYCRASLDKAYELATSAESLISMSAWYDEGNRDHR